MFCHDPAPLRHSRQYRRPYVAGRLTSLGTQATYVTVPYRLKNLTHSTWEVGALGLVELVPLRALGPYGGSSRIDSLDVD